MLIKSLYNKKEKVKNGIGISSTNIEQYCYRIS